MWVLHDNKYTMHTYIYISYVNFILVCCVCKKAEVVQSSTVISFDFTISLVVFLSFLTLDCIPIWENIKVNYYLLRIILVDIDDISIIPTCDTDNFRWLHFCLHNPWQLLHTYLLYINMFKFYQFLILHVFYLEYTNGRISTKLFLIKNVLLLIRDSNDNQAISN